MAGSEIAEDFVLLGLGYCAVECCGFYAKSSKGIDLVGLQQG